MSELMQSVLSVLGPERVDAMARQIGASPQQTERAIEAALPLMIGQMARNTAQPQGAQALQHALERGHAGVDLGGLLGSVLGGGGGGSGIDGLLGAVLGGARGSNQRDASSGAGDMIGSVLGSVFGADTPSRETSRQAADPVSDGLAILGHVFGQKQQRVANGVGQVGGIDGQQSNQLMAMLAPVLMAVLGKMMSNRGGGADALGGLLGGESRQMQQQAGGGGLLGAVLDRDGDGDVDLADLMQNGQLLGGLFGRR